MCDYISHKQGQGNLYVNFYLTDMKRLLYLMCILIIQVCLHYAILCQIGGLFCNNKYYIFMESRDKFIETSIGLGIFN